MQNLHVTGIAMIIAVAVLCTHGGKLPAQIPPSTNKKGMTAKSFNMNVLRQESKVKGQKRVVNVKSTAPKAQEKKRLTSWPASKSVIVDTGKRRADIIHSRVINNPILLRLLHDREAAAKKMKTLDSEIKELLGRDRPVSRQFVHGLRGSEAPSFLEPGRFNPADTLVEGAGIQPGTEGMFGVHGGTMILGPANAGSVTGLMGMENADVRSKTLTKKRPAKHANVQQRSNLNGYGAYHTTYLSHPDKNKIVQIPNNPPAYSAKRMNTGSNTAGLAPSAANAHARSKTERKKPNQHVRAQQRSNLNGYGTYHTKYLYYPDKNKILQIPNNAPASNTMGTAGVMSGIENAHTRSNTAKIEPPNRNAKPIQKPVTRKMTNKAQHGAQKSLASAAKHVKGHQKSDLNGFGTYEQDYLFYPDSKKLVAVPGQKVTPLASTEAVSSPAAVNPVALNSAAYTPTDVAAVNTLNPYTASNDMAANSVVTSPACGTDGTCAFQPSADMTSMPENTVYSDAAPGVVNAAETPSMTTQDTQNTAPIAGLSEVSQNTAPLSGMTEAAANAFPMNATVDNAVVNGVPSVMAAAPSVMAAAPSVMAAAPAEGLGSTPVFNAPESVSAGGAPGQMAASAAAALAVASKEQDDGFDPDVLDDQILGDPKKFDENCAVMKLTFERSQGDIIFDDSAKANDAQLENDAFISDESAREGLVMNLGEKGFLELADNFKGKPKKAVALSMWIKLKDVSGYNSLFHATGNDQITHYDLAVKDGRGLWIHRDDAGKELFRVESNGTAMTPDAWHHILGSYDAKKGTASLWVDGKETNTQQKLSGDLSRNWDRIMMFKGKTTGVADNVFIFRCPLDRTKVIALYVAVASPKDAKRMDIPRQKHKKHTKHN